MKNIKPILPVILILVGLGVGFFGGIEYRNYQLKNRAGNIMMGANGTQRFIAGRNGQGMMGRGGIAGSILSVDSNSITVKLIDGSTKIVFLGASTTYSNTVSATVSDVKTGENVLVTGTVNSDGSITAANVQLNPEFGRPQASPVPAK